IDAEHENIFKLRVMPSSNWDKDLTLDLLPDEAEIFYNSILSVAKGKLHALLLSDDSVWDLFYSSSNFMEFVEALQHNINTESIKEELILAHDFSELMFGAHITYNCLLQETAFGNNYFDEHWNEWIEELPSNMLSYIHFDIDRLISYSLHPKKSTVEFVRSWWTFVNSPDKNLKTRNALVEEQE